MKKVKNIFVVVVYRNTTDILDFLKSVKKQVEDYKVIIVNNYFDDETKEQFQKIAQKNDCDFINCENKGYGAGNNAGISFAIKNYDYDFLTISNPDIIIKSFPMNIINNITDGVIGGEIRNLSDKHQNPMFVTNNVWASRMIYSGLKYGSSPKIIIGKGINKIIRTICSLQQMIHPAKYRKVYQIHGSFLTLPKLVIKQIGTPYDERMFLFAEESYLAFLLKNKNIPTYYCPDIKVLHKEDGSMKFNTHTNEECIKSNVYFFEKYYFHTEEN